MSGVRLGDPLGLLAAALVAAERSLRCQRDLHAAGKQRAENLLQVPLWLPEQRLEGGAGEKHRLQGKGQAAVDPLHPYPLHRYPLR